MHHFVYIIYSPSSDKYYTGSAAIIDERLKRHNAGATPSTKTGRPWELVFSREFESKTEALKFELYIKKMKSRNYILQLIQSCSAG